MKSRWGSVHNKRSPRPNTYTIH